ncbi:hypothetical protein KKB44_03175 [Candidatus Micrarchaeota archaeon]|nr:hypothetical protein [Candidatus Micrarchaeota archaeon]
MRIFLFLFLISLTFAANVTPFLNLELETSCPGNFLNITTILSNGTAAADVELRLVRHIPYQGLRAIQHTNENGTASVELTNTGEYRIYIENSDYYNSDTFVEFNYSEMCPLPPPEEFNLSIEVNCNASILKITASKDGIPLENVFINTQNWSSLTGTTGTVFFLLEEGWTLIRANKSGYVYKESIINIVCTPPECITDENCTYNQYCFNESCINLTGVCGYPENHSWIGYECCEDGGCEMNFVCLNNSCISLPPQPENINNVSLNQTVSQEEPAEPPCIAALLLLFILLLTTLLNYVQYAP